MQLPAYERLRRLTVESLTAADREGRMRIANLVEYVRGNHPGFEQAAVIDVAPQIGVRQTRLIEGEYVVTKDDVMNRVHFPDSVARGPGLLHPLPGHAAAGGGAAAGGRAHYSATPDAQKVSREIPPCMAMGEAAGAAAALSLDQGVSVREVDVAAVQRRLREQGADPGDIPSPLARVAAPPAGAEAR